MKVNAYPPIELNAPWIVSRKALKMFPLPLPGKLMVRFSHDPFTLFLLFVYFQKVCWDAEKPKVGSVSWIGFSVKTYRISGSDGARASLIRL